MTARRTLVPLAAGLLLAAGACVSAAPPGDGAFRTRVTVDQATFAACAVRALSAKYPGSVGASATGDAGTVRIVRASPFEGYVMEVRRAGRGAEVEVRPGAASGALWKDLSLCLPPI